MDVNYNDTRVKNNDEKSEVLNEEKYELTENRNDLDNGVKFVLSNCEKTLKLIDEHEEYKDLKNLVIREYYYVKSIKYTGNMYEHFNKYKSGNHKYAQVFKFLEDYGIIPNEKMADYIKENFSYELSHYWSIDDLVVGNTYTNNEIASTFKCSNRGGMRRSLETNSLILIAKHINPLYDDQWTDEGILNYTGMGQVGDQSIEFSQNKTLAIAKDEGIKVYVFESYKDNEYYYNGEVEVAGEIYTSQEKDENGNMRKVLKYPLKLKKVYNNILIKEESLRNSVELKEKEAKKLSLEELKKSANKIENKTYSKEIITTYRDRNPIVSQYTKKRANGHCDLCNCEAPFINKNGEPYLESHHVITLAEGGPDVVYNTIALCPNCHRRLHALKDKNDIRVLVEKLYIYVKRDGDEVQLGEFRKLFKNVVGVLGKGS